MICYKIIDGDYLAAIGQCNSGCALTVGAEEITQNEYDKVFAIIAAKPTAHDGVDYRLKSETLEWEEFTPEVSQDEPEAEIEDYIEMLRELGVDV